MGSSGLHKSTCSRSLRSIKPTDRNPHPEFESRQNTQSEHQWRLQLSKLWLARAKVLQRKCTDTLHKGVKARRYEAHSTHRIHSSTPRGDSVSYSEKPAPVLRKSLVLLLLLLLLVVARIYFTMNWRQCQPSVCKWRFKPEVLELRARFLMVFLWV